MVTKRTQIITVAAGTRTIRGGRGTPAQPVPTGSSALNALIAKIAAAPENSWLSVNENSFVQAWPHRDYWAAMGMGESTPDTIINCWSGFGWDDTRARLILWGGGHANSNANSVYAWDGATMEWQLAFHDSDIKAVTGGMGYEPIDGALNAPQSSHTYSSNIWLPKLGKFFVFGGAASSSGGPFAVVLPDGSTRSIGGYALDMTLAGKGYVGGTTGSNVKRNSTANISLPGAKAWSVRDWFLEPDAAKRPGLSQLGVRTDGVAAYREENGHDVVYYKPSDNGLLRVEFVDQDYRNDIITTVGGGRGVAVSKMGGCLDTVRNLFVSLTAPPKALYLWDLNNAGPSNPFITVSDTGFTGPAAAEFLAQLPSDNFGITFDEKRNRYLLWERGGRLFSMEAPTSGPLTSGWVVKKLCDDTTSPRPATASELIASSNSDTGVSGKFKRSKSLDVYVALQGKIAGNIWMFKPAGWTDPRG